MSKEVDSELSRLLENYSIKKHGPYRELYFLTNWYRYKKNIKELDQGALNHAKTFFRSLKSLSPEDREFLAMKYDQPKRQSDKTLAKELAMDFKEYGDKRRAIEKQLRLNIIKQNLEETK